MIKLILLAHISFTFAYTPYNAYPTGKTLYYESQDAGDKVILTSFIKNRKIAAGRERARVTALDTNMTSYAGFFTVDEKCDSALFFWFFPSKNKPETDPISLWLQGGPGATSLFGLFTENGPYNLRLDGKLALREYSWNKNSSIIYIDNPVGTGYSYTNGGCYVYDEAQVGDDLLTALEQFFIVFPEYNRNRFYITGEAYAGKYMTALAFTILKAPSPINLQGIMIGNGIVDPRNQLEYSPYLYQLGLIDATTRDKMKLYEDICRSTIDSEDYNNAAQWLRRILDTFRNASGLSSHNYLKENEPPTLAALHNFVSQTNELKWSKSEEYQKADRKIWKVGSSIAGYAKSAGGLTEVLVRNAGHMVSADQPEWTFDLYNRFIFNRAIGS